MSLYNILDEILFYKICYYDYETAILFSMLCKKFNKISKGYGNDKRNIKDHFLKLIDYNGETYYVDKNTGIKNGIYVKRIEYFLSRHQTAKVKQFKYLDGKLYGVYRTWTRFGYKRIDTFYKYDKLHGEYKEYKHDKLYIKCNYDNGILHGKYEKWDKDDKILECNYTNGILHGQYCLDECNTKISSKYNKMINGILHGQHYFGDYRETIKCEYNNGLLHGNYYRKKRYRNKCTFVVQCEYNNDILHGNYKSYHKNLKLYIHCSYNKGVLHGQYIKYYNNGNKWIECNYVNGILDGEYKRWEQHGQLQTHCIYENGIVSEYYMLNMKFELYGIDNLWLE